MTTTARSTYAAISHIEQLFVDEYTKTLKVKASMIAAGYAESSAGVIGTRMMQKPHVALAIAKALEEKSMLARIDASWVLKRLARLADFSIKNFIVVADNGQLYYDFSQATDDDWYCINEITIGAVRANYRAALDDNDSGAGRIAVDQVKIKTGDKMKALELVGKHVDVQAFKERAGASIAPVTEVTRRIVSEPQPESLPPGQQAPAQGHDGPRIAHPKVPISGPVK